MHRSEHSIDWHYQPPAEVERQHADELKRIQREPGMLALGLRSTAAVVVRTYLRIYHRFQIVGKAHLPREGSFVLVSNHTSHLDTLCLRATLPLGKLHRAYPMAAADYFFTSVPRMLSALAVNALPFGRKTHVRQSLALCRQLLAEPGNMLVVFPEGTRSGPDTCHQIGEFKAGIGMVVAGIDVPVVPCFIDGAHRAMPKGRAIPLPSRIRLTIGRPLSFRDRPAGKASAETIAVELRDAVMQLRSNDRVDPRD